MRSIQGASKARGWHPEVCLWDSSQLPLTDFCFVSAVTSPPWLGWEIEAGWGWGMMLERAHWHTFLKHHKIFKNKVPQMTFLLMNYAFQQPHNPAFFIWMFLFLCWRGLVWLFVCLFVNSTLQKMVFAVHWYHCPCKIGRLENTVGIVFFKGLPLTPSSDVQIHIPCVMSVW